MDSGTKISGTKIMSIQIEAERLAEKHKKALIGFAGPRVVKETIGKDLPEGFQTSEFLLEKGFLDLIVYRPELKQKIAELLLMFKN